MQFYDENRFYDDRDPELDIIASRAKRASWRHRRVGPAYTKFGRKVAYHGSALNRWIDLNTVQAGQIEARAQG